MEEKVTLNISARHVHLTKEAIEILFGHELHVRNMLNQVGQYASEETVTIRNGENKIENVRIIGPARSYNQVEISAYDARKLGIIPPVKKSGKLAGAAKITIETNLGEITGNFAIIAERHVHFSKSDAKKYNVKDEEILKLEIGGIKPGIIDVYAKVSEDGFYEAHLDTDDANAFLITPGDIGVLRKWVFILEMSK